MKQFQPQIQNEPPLQGSDERGNSRASPISGELNANLSLV